MFLALLLSAAMAADDASEAYVWPLDLPRHLTSSFAEYRSGRFHAGIDLRTSGIGREVYASRAGQVTRVRCSPYGYGKAIYLQLDDGNILVYGHLDDFYPELRDYVRAAQHRSQKYTVDLYPEPGQFEVAKGQYIAKSGQTGIGAPHLHYELRDSANRPINPRQVGLDWEDTEPPRVRRIAIAPENAVSRIDGDLKPIILDVIQGQNGRLTTRPVSAYGGLGFGVDVSDPGVGGHSLGVYRMRLMVGGEEQFRMQHDRLDYSNHKNGAVAYHPYLLNQGKFLLLWRWPGNTCESYQQSASAGWVSVPEDQNEVQILVEDFYGNTTSVTVPIQHEQQVVVPPPAQGAGTAGTLDLEVYDDTLTASVTFGGAEPETPELAWIGPENGIAPMIRIGERTFRYRFAPKPSGLYKLTIQHPRVLGQERTIAAVAAGDDATFLLDDLEVHVPADAPYGRLFIQQVSSKPVQSPLRVHSDSWRLWPAAAPLSNPIMLSFPAPAEQAGQAAVYQQLSSWSHQNTAQKGVRFEVSARRLGDFALLEDTAPPSISGVEPAEGYNAPTRRPAIEANVTDNGSGIHEIEGSCGNQWLLMRYDPELNRVRWEQDEDLPTGAQTIRIVVSDESGNTRTVERNIVVAGG